MRLYVKSAGFSVNQDYSWVDESGRKADIDSEVLSYNVKGIKFVWKSTKSGIFIYGNEFVDRNRVDLYNRPLRNYILFEGGWDEADAMFSCFANMVLNQAGFERVLNSSVQNTDGKSEIGFSVDFKNIKSFCNTWFTVMEEHRFSRYLCEGDSHEARENLISELYSTLPRKAAVTIFVEGELSDKRLRELRPDRALLDSISDKNFYCASGRNFKISPKTAAITFAFGGITTGLLILAALNGRRKS